MLGSLATVCRTALCWLKLCNRKLQCENASCRLHLGVDVDERKRATEEHGGAAVEEQHVPHAQRALQRQAGHEHGQEPVECHGRHVDAVPRQVRAQRRKALIHLRQAAKAELSQLF